MAGPTVFKDDELLTFLNTPDSSPKKSTMEAPISSPSPSSLVVEHPIDSTDSISELSIQSDQSSPDLTHTSVDVPDLNSDNVNIRNENFYKHEIVHKLTNGVVRDQISQTVLGNGK